MDTPTIKAAKENAKKYETESEQDAYLRGFDRGYNCASWQDLPEIGAKLFTESDGHVTVTEDNKWDIVQSLAGEAESRKAANTTLIRYYEGYGYNPWHNSIDYEAAAESPCELCGHKGLDFRGFQQRGSFVAISICPECGNQAEF